MCAAHQRDGAAGSDVQELTVAGQDFHLGTPGPGVQRMYAGVDALRGVVGGHCLPIDPGYPSWQVRRSLGQSSRFVELANDVDEHMPDHVVRRLVVALNHRSKPGKGSRILLLGLSYEKNTGDARESPSHVLVRQLGNLGAEVRATDPQVREVHAPPGIPHVELMADELAAADHVERL